jgi:hypothetical protein
MAFAFRPILTKGRPANQRRIRLLNVFFASALCLLRNVREPIEYLAHNFD